MEDLRGYKKWFASEIETSYGAHLRVFKHSLFSDILPIFENLSQQAKQQGEAYFNRIGSTPFGNYEVDMADVADEANDLSLRWYLSTKVVRQTVINLMSVGIYHLVEQQLAAACQFYVKLHPSNEQSSKKLPKDRTLEELGKWFLSNFELDLKVLNSYEQIVELRLVANSIKHGEGKSLTALKLRRKDMFCEPNCMPAPDPFLEENPDSNPSLEANLDPNLLSEENVVVNPLGGEDLFVTVGDLQKYIDTALFFFMEIAQSIQANCESSVGRRLYK